MLTLMFLLLAQPITVTPTPAQRQPEAPRVRSFGSEAAPVYTHDIEIRQGDRILWQGALTVGGRAGSSISINTTGPLPGCSGDEARTRSGEQLNVYMKSSAAPLGANIDVRWTRPIGEGCPPAGGVRRSQVQQAIALRPAETRIIEVDDGMQVSVTRR